jgi:divalent metal cation (Fe/Co/Zn/Cd) transporter
MTIEEAHNVSDLVESKICEKINNCEVHVHQEPEDRNK